MAARSSSTLSPSSPPVTSPHLLERVALFSFRKLVLVRGSLTLPCQAELLEAHLGLIESVMRSFWQAPPAAALQEWKQLLAEQIALGTRQQNQRLVISFQTADDTLGLTGGFQLKIKTAPADQTALAAVEIADPAQPTAEGELRLPALPSLLEANLEQIRRLLEGLGQTVDPEEVEAWRGAIAPTLQQLFQASPNAYLLVRYQPLHPELGLAGGIKLAINGEVASIADEYHVWTQTRQGPLFGSHPDAKVVDIAAQLADRQASILDVGAGTGRNSLALARRGYRVDALELAPALAAQMLQAKTAANLSLSVIEGDILNCQLALPGAPYRLIFLSEVIASHFRSIDQVRTLLTRLVDLLQPGGQLLFNAFVASHGYQPTPAELELAQAFWSCLFTRDQLDGAVASLPLQLISDESAVAYEQIHLPSEAWPPTEWFLGWATGRNLFPILEQPPIELRWMMYEKH